MKKSNSVVICRVLFLGLFLCISKSSAFTSTPNIGEWLIDQFTGKEDLSGHLFILDLDQTTLTTETHLGCAEWMEETVRKIAGHSEPTTSASRNGVDKKLTQVIKSIAPLFTYIMDQADWKLTDDRIPQAISEIKKKRGTVIGITSRADYLADHTDKVLRQHNVLFSSDMFDEEGSKIVCGNQMALAWQGVVYCGVSLDKADAIETLLYSMKLKRLMYSKIIFIDDQENSLDAMGTLDSGSELHELEIEIVLCTYKKTSGFQYQSTLATQALMDMMSAKPDLFLAPEIQSVIGKILKTM